MVKNLLLTSLVLILPGLSLLSCTDQGGVLDYSGIADPEQRWLAYHLHDYTIVQYRTCFCADGGKKYLITVVGDSIAGVTELAGGTAVPRAQWGPLRTVGDLFTLVKTIDTTAVASSFVTYDVKYGFPATVSVNPNALIADAGYAYVTELVTPPFN